MTGILIVLMRPVLLLKEKTLSITEKEMDMQIFAIVKDQHLNLGKNVFSDAFSSTKDEELNRTPKGQYFGGKHFLFAFYHNSDVPEKQHET